MIIELSDSMPGKIVWVQSVRLNFCQPFQVSVQHRTLQDEAGEFTFTDNLDQAGCLQLFHVMRKCGGAHTVDFMQLGAGRRVAAGPNLFKNLVSSWFGQCPGYPGKLPVCKAASFRSCHLLQGTPDPIQMSRSRGPETNGISAFGKKFFRLPFLKLVRL